jgi:hypothetical protein
MTNAQLAASRRALFACALASLAACDLDVVNPGRIQDEDLNNPSSAPVILVGLISDVEVAIDEIIVDAALGAGEMGFSGTRSWYNFFAQGIMNPADTNVIWDPAGAASWTTSQGVERITGLVENAQASLLVAQANMWAGIMQRAMGDVFCQSVFNGGPAEPNARYYERAIEYFTQARTIAGGATGALADSVRIASAAGLAQSHLALGNYAQAATFAAEVPTPFMLLVHRSGNSNREENLMWSETVSGSNRQLTVFGTEFVALGPTGDPRAPWATTTQLGNGGTVQFYRQLKYNDRGSDIAAVKGAEMRLIEAEVVLRAGDVAGAMERINALRAAAGLAAKTAASADEAWRHLIDERAIVLWMEGRRLKDRQRFATENRDPFLTGRAGCFPFSQNEINSNPNLR